jgi:hypothetical protein
MKPTNPFSRGGRQSHKNRGLVIIDGDNVRDIFRKYNRWPDMRRLLEWIVDPENLGIDQFGEIVYCATVYDVKRPTAKEIPLSSLGPIGKTPITLVIEPYSWVPWAGLSPLMQSKLKYRSNARRNDVTTGNLEVRIGLQDEAIFQQAIRRIRTFESLVCVSSDWDFLRLTQQLSTGKHPFMPHAKRRTILIGSKINASVDWAEAADELVEIEAILPQLSFSSSLIVPRTV